MRRGAVRGALLDRAPLLLFAAVLLTFGVLSPRFFAFANFVNILVHASSLGIVAVGMTFVLLTAGIDLSAGAAMFLAGIAAGKVVLAGGGVVPALGAALAVSLLWGALNAFFVVRLRIAAFVVTLATLYAGRGLGLMITETRAMNLPEELRAVGAARILGVPFPVLAFALVVLVAHLVLTRTPFGRQVYAVGADAEGAKRAGLRVPVLLASVYLVSALCAGLGGFVSVAQIGAVSPTFGQQRELAAIAAAVLGGTSLFGGRGQVLPGTVIGALLMQTVETGLVILNVDPYLYPLVTAGVIFAAVAIDSLRNREALRRAMRKIRPVAAERA